MTLERDDEPTIEECREFCAHTIRSEAQGNAQRYARALLRRLEREAETPSEAEAREWVDYLIQHRRVGVGGECAWFVDGPCTCGASAKVDDYRAAVLREAETVALVERLREQARKWEWHPVLAEADAWLAARRKGER